MLVSKVPKFPVVNDFDLGLVRATGDTFDETRAVGWDVDAGGVVYLLYHRVSLLATTARSTLALPRYLRNPTRLHFILIDGIFGLRVFLQLIAFKWSFGRPFLLLFFFIGNIDGSRREGLLLLEELPVGFGILGESDGSGTSLTLI